MKERSSRRETSPPPGWPHDSRHTPPARWGNRIAQSSVVVHAIYETDSGMSLSYRYETVLGR